MIHLKRIFNGKSLSGYIRSEMVMNDRDYTTMRGHLLREDDKERASFLFCGIKGRENIKEIYVHRVINIEDADYDVQNTTYILPSIKRTLRIFRDFEESRCPLIVFVHSHPFSENAIFSTIDLLSVQGALRSIDDYLRAGECMREFVFGTMVIGRSERGFTGHLYKMGNDNPDAELSILRVVGEKGQRKFASFNIHDLAPETLLDRELLDRNIRWLGEDGQEILSSTNLVICGLGGVGGFVALNVRGAGASENSPY